MRRSLQSAIFLLLQVLFKTKNQTLPWLQDVYCYNWFPPFWWNLYFSKLMTLIRFILLFYHQHWPNQVENKWSRKNPLISFVLDSDWCWVLKQWDVNWKYKSLNEFSGFSFSFITPLFFKHKVILNQDEYFWDLFVAAHCRGWLMLSYLVRSDFMDSSLVSSGSYIFSWMPNRRFLSHFVLREETALGLVCCSERLSVSFYYSNLASTLSKCKQIHSVLCPPTVVFVSLKTSIKSRHRNVTAVFLENVLTVEWLWGRVCLE